VAIVAILELDNRSPDFLQVPEDATMNGLLLQCPVEALGDAIRLWLGNEGEARRDAPEPDLVQEVIGRVLRTVDALLNVKLGSSFFLNPKPPLRRCGSGLPTASRRRGRNRRPRRPAVDNPRHPTHVQIANACLSSGTDPFEATWT
jgi:hypothetical protein